MIKLLILSSLLLQGLLATRTDIIVIPLKVGSHTVEIKNALPLFVKNGEPYFTTTAVSKSMYKLNRLSNLASIDAKSYHLSKGTNGTLVLKYTLIGSTSDNVSLKCVTNQRKCLECKPFTYVFMDKGYCVVQGLSTYSLEMIISSKDYTLAPTVEPTPSPTPSPDSQVPAPTGEPTPSPTPSPDSDSQVTEPPSPPKDSSSATLVSMVSPMLLLLVAGLATNPYL